MLEIRAIKIVANTINGIFSSEFEFDSGFNIIRGNNTSGKSTLLQSILYGLGMEELLDGKNEKTMQSTLKDSVEYPKGTLHKIIESHVILEIRNKETITIKRTVINQNKSSKLVEVFDGSLLIDKEENLEIKPMWLHDKGGASNVKFGFHAFLAEFLELKLPDVYYSKGDLKKLYIQTIFPSFIIEQKKGWADFLMTIPFYGTRNVKNRVIEYILNLDVFENEKEKIELNIEKSNLIDKWKYLRTDLFEVANRGGIDIDGLPTMPDVLTNLDYSYFTIYHENERLNLSNFLGKLNTRYEELTNEPISTTGERLGEINSLIRYNQNELDTLSLNFDLISRNIRLERDKSEIYRNQLLEVREELKENKDAKKIYSLGATIELAIPQEKCPTCNQKIKDSLLPQSSTHTPMHLDENIGYLQAQEKMIIAYLAGQEKGIKDKELEANNFYSRINTLRNEIRQMKKELIEDERMPSITKIEERIKLKSRIDFYSELIEALEIKLEAFRDLSKRWQRILRKEKKFSKNFFSPYDIQKLKKLEDNFKALVSKFGYRSKPLFNIKISKNKYLPIVEGDSIKYDIRFDSSASDMIRSIWSYTCSLYKVSRDLNGNHPNLLVFDEPAQQSMSNDSFNKFLLELETYKNAQVLLFASFNNSDEDFLNTTEGVVDFKLHKIGDKLLKPNRESEIN